MHVLPQAEIYGSTHQRDPHNSQAHTTHAT